MIRQAEHLIAAALRETGALRVSLMAVTEGRIVGHIAASKAGVGDSVCDWCMLDPVAVRPDVQGQ